jgi:hypothetical protein
MNVVMIVSLAGGRMSPPHDGIQWWPQVHRTGSSLGMTWGTRSVLDQRRHLQGWHLERLRKAKSEHPQHQRSLVCHLAWLQRFLRGFLSIGSWGLGRL